MKRNATIVCDLMYGSTGKGACVGYLAMKDRPDTVITAWAPNSGHTFIDENGRKFVHCMLANGVVSPALQTVMIAPGSVVDLDRLKLEIEQCKDLVFGKRLVIHRNAAVVDQKHRDIENITMTGIGSTKKGSGAALIEKIQRQVPDTITVGSMEAKVLGMLREIMSVEIVDTAGWVEHLNAAHRILIEGAQGFSLGLNSGFYPYGTSRECTPAQIMSDTLVSMNRVSRVIGVMRTFPIRVSNRYDEKGEVVGWSGPGYPDQEEITWDQVGQAPEFTTVTQLQRRVFTFSWQQTREAMAICAPDEVFMSFCDYLKEDEVNARRWMINRVMREEIGFGRSVKYMSFGPSIKDVQEVKDDRTQKVS